VGARQKGLAVFEEEIRRNRRHMAKILPGYALRNFAYPGGELTLRLKRRMRQYAISSRGTYNGINRRQGGPRPAACARTCANTFR